MIGLILFGNFATCLLIGLAGSFRGTIAGLSPALVIVMATIAASVNASEDAILVTVYCALALSAVATGACCLLIGFFRLAVLMRFIPYPVAAGFVSGLGGIVCVAAMSSMAADADLRDASSLLNPAVAGVWIPGAIYGVALYIATRRWGNPLILPASVVALILPFCRKTANVPLVIG